MNILELIDLSIGIKNDSNTLLKNVDLSIRVGEVMGLVGESGSGKTLLSLGIMGLLPKNIKILNGNIKLNGESIIDPRTNKIKRIASDITMIFQNPKNALNPTMKIGDQIINVIRHNSKNKKESKKSVVFDLLNDVGIPGVKRIYESYPHQLSGGMCQRVMIAMALVCKPKILIADEPTTALDVTIQAQIFELLKKFISKTNSSILFITHDLDAVAEISDKVAVLYSGQMMEIADCNTIINNPQHPYSKFLIDSIKNLNQEEMNIKKENLSNCQYSQRCNKFSDICDNSKNLFHLNKDHKTSCVKVI